MRVKDLLGIVSPGALYRYGKAFDFGDIEFTDVDPDLLLFFLSGDLDGDGFLPLDGEFRNLRVGDLPDIRKLADLFDSTPRLFYVERMDKCPDFVKAEDIVYGHETLPKHPNRLKSSGWVDETVFYPDSSVERVKKSAVIMADHDEHIRLICELMDEVVILGTDDFTSLYQHKDLLRYRDKITVAWIEPEDEDLMRETLSEAEFVISSQDTHGLEILAIEALFCGCQPVVIDNGHFKENIFNGLDFIRYFDSESPYATITSALDVPSSIGDAEVKQAVDKFSAQKHVPLFWEEVKEKLNQR